MTRTTARHLASRAVDALLARNIDEWSRLRREAAAADERRTEISRNRLGVARGCAAVLRMAAAAERKGTA